MISTIANDAVYEFIGLQGDVMPIGENCSNANHVEGAPKIIKQGSTFFVSKANDPMLYVLMITPSQTEGQLPTGTWIKLV